MNEDEFVIDTNDPYYKKIQKLIMYRNSYKSLEKEFILAKNENANLKEELQKRNEQEKNDYNNVVIENQQLRERIKELEKNQINSKNSDALNELKIKYDALSSSIKETVTDSDLLKENEELKNTNKELDFQICELSKQLMGMDDSNTKLQEENESLNEKLNKLKENKEMMTKQLKEKKQEIKKMKDEDEEQRNRIIALEVKSQENEQLKKELSEAKGKLAAQKQFRKESLKSVNRENQRLQEEIRVEKEKSRHAIEKYELINKENDKLKVEKAKLIGQLEGIDYVQQVPVISMKFEKENEINTYEEENAKVKSKLNETLISMNSMYKGLRSLLMKSFIEMPFNLNWDGIMKFLEERIEDLKAISSDRDVLSIKLNKANKRIQELTNEITQVKQDSQEMVLNSQKLMDKANEKLEDFALTKPYIAFQTSVMNRTSKFISNLVKASSDLCQTIDGVSLEKGKLRSVVICSIAALRLFKKNKNQFEPQAILTYSSRTPTNIIQRLNNCLNEVKENEKFALASINDLIYREKYFREACREQENSLETYKLKTDDYIRENRELQTKVASMFPSKEIIKRDQKLSEIATFLASKESENNYLNIELKKTTKERDLARKTCQELQNKLSESMIDCKKMRRQYMLSQMQVELQNKPIKKKKRHAKTLDRLKATEVLEFRKELSDMSESLASASPIHEQ